MLAVRRGESRTTVHPYKPNNCAHLQASSFAFITLDTVHLLQISLTSMLTQFHPSLVTLPLIFRFPVDLFSGFALVYLFRRLYTTFERWHLIRSHSTQSAAPAPVLRLQDVPGPSPPSWLWGSE